MALVDAVVPYLHAFGRQGEAGDRRFYRCGRCREVIVVIVPSHDVDGSFRAASDGVGFLPIYIGPTLMVALWWIILRKMLRITKVNRITSIADFVASRYGKSALLGGLVTVIAVVGIVPYISLQLKAVSGSFSIVMHYPEIINPARSMLTFDRIKFSRWVACH